MIGHQVSVVKLIDELRRRDAPDDVVARVEASAEALIKERRQPQPPSPQGGISIREGERKYKIPSSTISRWVKRKWIPVFPKISYKKFIDEARMAELARVFYENEGRGTWAVKKYIEKQRRAQN